MKIQNKQVKKFLFQETVVS